MHRQLLRLVGVLEIAGGLFGLADQVARLFPWGGMADMLRALLGTAVFALMLLAGVLLLEHQAAGSRLSRWMQLAQLPVIATPMFSYALHAGAFFDVVLVFHHPIGVNLDGQLGAWRWTLAAAGPHTVHLGVNAAALAGWLVLQWRRA
jgi:hypothetical protein